MHKNIRKKASLSNTLLVEMAMVELQHSNDRYHCLQGAKSCHRFIVITKQAHVFYVTNNVSVSMLQVVIHIYNYLVVIPTLHYYVTVTQYISHKSLDLQSIYVVSVIYDSTI